MRYFDLKILFADVTDLDELQKFPVSESADLRHPNVGIFHDSFQGEQSKREALSSPLPCSRPDPQQSKHHEKIT